MVHKLIPKREIEKSKRNEQIIRETSEQVMKDFGIFGMEIHLPEDLNYAYDDLFDQLTIIIFELMQKKPEKLSALLYHIDVDEKKMKAEPPPVFKEHEWITDLILEREFFKVLTRHYFRDLNH
ncbi:MAG: hypothetical protein ACOCZL_06990 [Bacteroidota bacterium]